MLSNSNHNGEVYPSLYPDESPRWLTSSVGENGEEIFVETDKIDFLDDISDDAFSIKSEIKNGTMATKPVVAPLFHRISARDNVESQLNHIIFEKDGK